MSKQTPVACIVGSDRNRMDSLSCLLNATGKVECLTPADDPEKVISSAMQAVDKPDILILSVDVPNLHTLDLIAFHQTSNGSTPIIIISASLDDRHIKSCMEYGASGYLLDDWSAENIADAIREALDGGLPLDSRVSRILFNQRNERQHGSGHLALTLREREILKMLLDLRSVLDIARTLEIAEGTVRWHIKQLHAKFGTHKRSHLVLKAMRHVSG